MCNVGTLLLFVCLLLFQSELIETKPQFVEPLNMGMKMSIAYDVANLFIRPVAGVISTVIAVALAGILFFGVITSPFGYMFGIPSRKYVLGGESNLFPSPEAESRSFFSSIPHSNHSFEESLMRFFDSLQDEFYPDFLDSMFYFMPQLKDLNSEQCRLLTLCQAHGALPHLPGNILKIYQTFSHKLAGIPSNYKKAILIGIRDESTCPDYFDRCEDNNAFTIALKSYLNLLPEDWRKSFKHTNRRKGAMYMPSHNSNTQSTSHSVRDEL